MRLLMFVSRDPANPQFGGGETVLWEWAREAAKLGHEITYLCSTFPNSARISTVDGIRIVRIGTEIGLGLSAWREYRSKFRGTVDLVIEDMLAGKQIPFLAALYVKEPMLAVWHQDHLPLFRAQYPPAVVPFLGIVERVVVRVHRNCVVLSPSQSARDSYVGKGGRADRAHVFQMGLSPEFLNQTTIPRARERKPVALFLGKLRRFKRPDYAIRAFEIVARRMPEARMIVAGRPDENRFLDELRRQIRDLGLTNSVSLELSVSEARKMELLRSSRALISATPVEGFGIAILEASACGLPTVGTTGVPEESLKQGVNGFRVPSEDIQGMAEWTTRLLSDDQLFDAISINAQSLAKGHSWRRSVQSVLEFMGTGTAHGT